ncbi:aspartate dehydrogenase domain-containing protein [Rhodococcus sp. 852002-51564_SCH6189132-a]|uniref:aspartate dehydrogenase domain-containing protein n=1 Tax=Rhodococcus sp. 852002-51564_SCH6189132-a TaxID=1834103 RepID=UPI001E4B6B72|nr:aspartate dehydrogenase domain-containing protein [Rhodococcus sp. 852002-51564_SCH6189132-a]
MRQLAPEEIEHCPIAVCVVGTGAIGQTVIDALRDDVVPDVSLAAVLNSRSSPEEAATAFDAADIVVEAATVDAARTVLPEVVKRGKNTIVCSCGVFADRNFEVESFGSGPSRVLLPTGAIGGFDVLAAATRAGTVGARLTHTTIKRPSALGIKESLDVEREVFRGSAREAALTFPRTSNSSVALALATLGLDRVEVVVIADPAAASTRHVVEWESPLGRYELTFENAIDPASSGRTSSITAWSVIGVLAALPLGIGPGAVVLGPSRRS